ncbi:MAG TPA: UvrD-helicase domain-containing protein [Acidimicrobiia bacterium]|nr:UvrD-helicase domain-containing protein [Acidimicrobiia bacterium]
MTAIVDQTARDEIRADLGRTLFIEAGAGTGKTAALVSRVVALVTAGTPLRRIAAITFTEAAASELRDRIRLELERAAGGETDPPLPDEARRRCAAALHELDDAALATLHGFAHQLLVEQPLAAGLPPRFEVVDDIEAGITFHQHWGDFVDTLMVDPHMEDVLLHAFALGLRLDDLRHIAAAFHEHHDRIADAVTPETALPRLDVDAVTEPLRTALGLAGECTNDDDALAKQLHDLEYCLRALDGAEDDLERLDLLARFPKINRGQIGARGNWRCDIGRVRDYLGASGRAVDELLTRARLAVVTALVARIRDFVLRFADERRRDGRLEFHDLLVLARDLLRRRADVRIALAQRYAAILVDEFQDTDPLQIEIAVLLATTDPDAGKKPWYEVVLEPGRVFFVGDPKQSIYRFRRADLALYHRVEDELRDGLRHLVQNFRSVPGVIEFVNHVFEALFAEPDPGRQAAHVALAPHRDALATDEPAVQVFGEPVAATKIGPIREREAAEVAALVRRVKAEGWPVHDVLEEKVRPARYGDIALLIPTRTALPELERALEEVDVPVRIESQSLVYATAEVRDLLAILTALDDPTDEIALVAALRTPAFGCSDTELVEYRLAGGHWDYRPEPDMALPDDHRVVAGIAALRALHDGRWWKRVSETVAAVVRQRRLLALAVAHRRPRDHWRRIRFLLDQARAYDERGGTGLRGFVEWVRQQADERARAVEVVVPEPDDDAVRVLTVHGAKGLEFPVVVLAGLNASPQLRNPAVLWTDHGFEVGVGVKKRRTWVETDGYAEQAKVERALDEDERLRLLYVATTRARDYLLVSLHHKETDKKCHAARLSEHVEGAPAIAVAVETQPELAIAPSDASEAAVADELAARSEWIVERDARLRAAARSASVAATALAAAASGDEEPDVGLRKEAEPDDERPPWQRGRAGTAVGRAVHATLQSVDLPGGDDLVATATAQAWAEEIPTRAAEVRDLVRSVLDAPIVRAAVAGGRFWREVPVATTVAGTTVEGFVDLLVETAEGLVVVDYKTDAAPGDEELDALMAKYRVQGATYALALERVLDRPVARCVFVFARRGSVAVEREVADLPAVVAEVEARVQAMS